MFVTILTNFGGCVVLNLATEDRKHVFELFTYFQCHNLLLNYLSVNI